jgi:PAS domain-containing protein
VTAVRPDGALLEELLTLAPVGLALLDESRRYIWVNDELARINGKPVEAHVGRSVDVVIPDLAGRIRPHHRRALEGGEIVRNVEVGPDSGHGPHMMASYYPATFAGLP